MTLEQLQAEIQSIIDSPTCAAEFFFILKEQANLVIKRPDMDQDAQEELGNQFKAALREKFIERDGISLVELTNADNRANAIYRYDLDDIPIQLQVLSQVIDTAFEEPFDFHADSLRNLEGIVILIGDQNKQVALYKHHYPVTLLQQNTGFIARVKGSSRFEKLDQDILKINPNFDFIALEGQHYIVEIKTLERFFGFQDAIKNVAAQAIAIVHQSALIVNTSVLTDRLSDMTFCRKLASLTKNSMVLGVVPNADIIAFVTGHPKLSKKFSFNAAQTQFHLKTKISQGLFLKLMNDDYLKSLLTQNDYDSLAKDNLLPDPVV